jgi:threonine/homoserine/homoserine lactone efflux protein
VHFWQGWSVARSYLFGMFVIFLTFFANALARRTHSAMILTLVELGGLLLITWVGWIFVWNLRHRRASPKKE